MTEPCSCNSPGYCIRHLQQKNPEQWITCLGKIGIRRQLDVESGWSSVPDKSIFQEIKNKLDGAVKKSIPININDVHIAILGHNYEQMNNIEDRSYLKKYILKDLQLNQWGFLQSESFSESRAFFCDDLFPNNAEYVGVVTGSWNSKFNNSKIDDFHNWENTSILAGNKNVVLCAHSLGGIDSSGAWNRFKYKEEIKKRLCEITGINDPKYFYNGIWSNQIICRKKIYDEYCLFLKSKIHQLLDELHNHLESPYDDFSNRKFGYIIELVTWMWFASQSNLLVITNAKLKPEWYS